MSRENVDIVRRMFEAWNAPTASDDLSSRFHPAVELGGPDVPEVFHGYEGLRRFRDDILSAWDYFYITPEEFIESGGDVLALARGRGRGRSSGVEFEQFIAYLCTVQQGKITRLWIFQDRNKALEAAGLRSSFSQALSGPAPALDLQQGQSQ